MKIELLISRATATGTQNRGDKIDVSQSEAIRMIEAGQAIPVREDVKPERTTRQRRSEKGSN